ncbi:hypothetical protein GFD17_06105 [Bifidobacterium sp. SMB2]|uniref:UDP-N-acetylglucosamine kinase n=1 Tax=Bifidobacterium saimiriisciurei TaxID=2661627 RepID=A0ABX0C7A0_9BIFI|nr:MULTISPECIES: zeta toxin family protein [Bifidobacterium]NEG96329.1 hypothetical protein [Bifidobacterium sp. SMB2]NEH11039.1 hypothetical protein [Bifidobacterium saimiriisciurei]
MNDDFVLSRWKKRILPTIAASCEKSAEPVTIFIGGQPGSGKTRTQIIMRQRYSHNTVLPIIGDDFRQYHPQYRELLENHPLDMPDVTADAAGAWRYDGPIHQRKRHILHYRRHLEECIHRTQ